MFDIAVSEFTDELTFDHERMTATGGTNIFAFDSDAQDLALNRKVGFLHGDSFEVTSPEPGALFRGKAAPLFSYRTTISSIESIALLFFYNNGQTVNVAERFATPITDRLRFDYETWRRTIPRKRDIYYTYVVQYGDHLGLTPVRMFSVKY